MKIVYEVRLYDTPRLELILEEKGKGAWSCGRYPVCGGRSEAFTAPDLQLSGVGILA